MTIDELPIEIRFQTPNDPPLGPRDGEARALAFPGGRFASDIEFAGRQWRFSQTELMKGPSDTKPTWKRLVYFEKSPPT